MHGDDQWTLAVPTAALGPDVTIEHIIAEARRVGFNAVEPTFGHEGHFTLDTPEALLRDFAARLHAAGLAVSALCLTEASTIGLAGRDEARLQSTAETIRAGLRAAASVATDILILAPRCERESESSAPPAPHETTLLCALNELLALRFDAQRFAIHLALRSPSQCLFPTPQASRDFLDRINSPWAGACLDLDRLNSARDAIHWIETLGHRLRCVRFLSADETDLRPAFAALRRARYTGPITCLNAGRNLADVISRTRAAML